MTPQPPLDRDGAPLATSRPSPPSPCATYAARPLLLGLVVASAFWLFAPRAEAACAPDAPPLADGGSVTCTGTDETGFDASGNTNVSVTTSGTTILDDSGAEDAAIVVGDGNTVVLGADATLNVTDSVGLLGGDDNDVDLGGTINVTADDGVGVRMGSNTDPSSPSAIEIQNTGDITVTGANGIGIDVVDNYDVTNEVGGTITVEAGADGGIAMRGVDDNILWNSGTILLNADDARAIQIRDNTGLPLPNGAINDGTVTVNGANGIVIEVGDNVGTLLGGTVELFGANGRGLSIGNRTDAAAQANHTNNGTINVAGDGSIGLEAGDGWFSGSGASIQSDVRNSATIDVSGANAFGIRVGDDVNTSGNHNSFVTNFTGATITVTGTDSVGVSLGGNDVLTGSDTSLDDIVSFANDGTITGDADAGPLIEFRNAFGTFENRVLNFTNGVIAADRTNAGSPNRGIAILGTDGVEAIENAGEINGDLFLLAGEDVLDLSGRMDGAVDLGDDDDTFRISTSAAIADGVVIDGGSGTSDTVVLGFDDTNEGTFDLSDIAGFERVELEGSAPVMGLNTSAGWSLRSGSGFTGDVEVRSGSRLRAAGESNPLDLGGDLTIESGAAVEVRIEGPTTPLVAAGTATLAGDLDVLVDPGLDQGTYGVLQAGAVVGAFDSVTTPAPSGLVVYSTVDTPNGLDLVIARVGTFGDPLVAFGANNQAIGTYLDAIDGDAGTSAALQTELNLIAGTNGSLSSIFTALSPESYDAQSAVVMEGGRRVARILMERPRQCTPGEMDPWQGGSQPIACHARRWAPWISGVGSYRSRDGFSGHPEYDALLGGIVVGLDAPSIGGFDFTLAVSSQHGKVDFERFGDADLTMAEISGHAAWRHGPVRVQGVASWAHTRHESRRAIVFSEGTGANAIAQSLSATEDFDSSRFLLAAEVGARFDVGPIQIEPIAALDWIRMEVDGLTESGAGVYDARIGSRDDDVFTTRAGLRLGTVYEYRRYLHRSLEWATGVWRPTLDLRWRQTISGNERDVSASLVQAPTTAAAFTVGAKEDAGGFEVGAGLSFAPKYANRLQLQLRYDLYRASHTLDHDLTARLRIGF